MSKLYSVYYIFCISECKYYIGQSSNIKKRFREHINKLNRADHENINLQEDWIANDFNNFIFGILESNISHLDINTRETYWIQKYQSYQKEFGYNQSFKALAIISLKKHILSKRKNNQKISVSKPILQYSAKTGLFIREFKSATYANVILGGGKNRIYPNNMSDQKYRFHYNEEFIFIYKDSVGHTIPNKITLPKTPKERRYDAVRTPIAQLTKNGIFLRSFPSLTEASKDTGAHMGNILRAIKNPNASCHGYKWRKVDV